MERSSMTKSAGKASEIKAVINDRDCMCSVGWIDYVTDSKNEEFISGLMSANELGPNELFEYVQEKMPGWIVAIADEYDPDLSKFSDNWSKLCSQMNRPTQKILIVESFFKGIRHPEKKFYYNNVTKVCDLLTRSGFVVKDMDTFSLCKGCSRVMISEDAQRRMFPNTDKVWKVCRECTASGKQLSKCSSVSE